MRQRCGLTDRQNLEVAREIGVDRHDSRRVVEQAAIVRSREDCHQLQANICIIYANR